MNLAVITGGYPSALNPMSGAFVRQFVLALARQGHRCTVVSPAGLLARRFGPLPPKYGTDVAGEVQIPVFRPRILSFSRKCVGGIRCTLLTQAAFNRGVFRILDDRRRRTDVYYGHFLYLGGYSAACAGQRYGAPSIAAVGEGSLWSVRPVGIDLARKQLQKLSGFAAVSSVIRDTLIQVLNIPEWKIGTFPNGVDLRMFCPIDKRVARQEFKLEPTSMHIAFVGSFDEMKGLDRLMSAVRGLDNVRLLLLGEGPLNVESSQIAFKSSVTHEKVALALNAADIFVLPTREEGSCNAVIEAMACGLPIITSDGRYMDDVVGADVVARVAPDDVSALRREIHCLLRDPARRSRMAAAGLARSKLFDIDDRARRVTAWIETVGRLAEARYLPAAARPSESASSVPRSCQTS